MLIDSQGRRFDPAKLPSPAKRKQRAAVLATLREVLIPERPAPRGLFSMEGRARYGR